MFVAVRAIAPVAGNPPNIGETIFATPCAINSTFGLCWSLLMRSETTADISDSIAPSIATVNAGPKQSVNQVRPEIRNRQMRQAAGNPAKARADGFHRQFENQHRRCAPPAKQRSTRECDRKRCGTKV